MTGTNGNRLFAEIIPEKLASANPLPTEYTQVSHVVTLGGVYSCLASRATVSVHHHTPFLTNYQK
jgi:hypothetical protein